jgi:hypothetical protein
LPNSYYTSILYTIKRINWTHPIEGLNYNFKGIIMNAKEFDDMEADLKYRKHLKYSESDMDEKLKAQREQSAEAVMNADLMDDTWVHVDMAVSLILNAEIEK